MRWISRRTWHDNDSAKNIYVLQDKTDKCGAVPQHLRIHFVNTT
jgi:hypothetical protein